MEYIIAGGEKAIFNAIEGAEDDKNIAFKEVTNKNINSQDVIIGLAASGNTPFTCGFRKKQEIEMLTIAISNNPKGKILRYGIFKIILNTREEVIAGSTRLKAGTAQKICLNTI